MRGGRWLAVASAALGLLAGPGTAHAVTKTVSFDELGADTTVERQYETSHGVFFLQGDRRPVTRSNAGQAKSGAIVAELPTGFLDCSCEDFDVGTTGRVNPTARTVSVWVGVPSTSTAANIKLEAFNTSSDVTPIASSTVAVTSGGPLVQVTVTSPNLNADIAKFRIDNPEGQVMIIDDLAITTPDMPSPPDFGFAVLGDPPSVPVGSFIDVPISISRLNGSNGDVSFAVTNLPPGMRAEITPNPVTGTNATATMRLSALENADRFVQYREITVTGTAGPGAGTGSRSVKVLTRIVDNCTKVFRTDFIDLRSECIKETGPDKLQVVSEKARINGLVIEPASGDRTLTIDRKERTITSDGDIFVVTHPELPELPIYAGPVNWDLGTEGSGPKTVLDYDITGVKKLKAIPVQRIAVAFTKAGKTNLSPTLRLSFWPFSYIGALTSTTRVTIDNDHPADFSGLEVKVDRIAALGLELKNVSVKWQQGGTWAGGATVVLRFVSPYEVGAGFGLKDGDFDFIRGSVGGLNVAVGPAVFLQRIGFEVKRSPLTLTGSVGFSAGPLVAGKRAVGIDGALKAVLADPWIVEVSGKAKVAERFELGEAFLRYTSGGLLELGGKASWDLRVASISGSIAGFVDGGHNKFNLEGSVRGCITIKYLPDPCAGAAFLVSDIGIAGCVDLTVVSGGIGYYWGGDFDLFGGSCDLSPWRSTAGASVYAVGAGQGRRFTLPANLPSAAFEVVGVGDAPGVTLTGPRGETVTVSRANPFVRTGNLVAMMAENNVTYVVVRRPSAGTWTLTDDGTVGVSRVRQAAGLPDPSVRARVTGRGHARVLRWRLRRIAGQRVTFVEVGQNLHKVIATTSAAGGQARFRPADGPAGRRKIVALVEQGRLLRRSVDAGSYLAPARLRPTRPRRVRLTRRGSRLVARWTAPHNGFRHLVYFSLGDGRRLLRIASTRARSVTLRGVAPRFGATVTVAGLTHANGRGPSARASIRGSTPRPAGGPWRMTSDFSATSRGGFTVPRGARRVTNFRVIPSAAAGGRCGRTQLEVRSSPAISSATRSGAAIWVIGRRAPRSLDGVTTMAVTVSRGRTRARGALKVAFTGRRTATGELRTLGCRLLFNAQR